MPSNTLGFAGNNFPDISDNELVSLPSRWITGQLHRTARGFPPPGGFRQMLYLKSPPGYGKTAFMKALVRRLNETDPLLKNRVVLLETVLAAHENSSDIMGTSFPITYSLTNLDGEVSDFRNSRRGVIGIGDESLPIRHVVQTWTPILRQIDRAVADGKIVLWFFDEFNNINSQWEANILKLCEGRFKEWVLPDAFVLVGAGNPPEQSIHGGRFGESLKSRLYMVPFVPDYNQWREYMLADGQKPENFAMRLLVADFIEINRNYFVESESAVRDAHQLGHIATNPRSWTLTADSLARLYRYHEAPPSPEQVKWVVERRIPASVASEFMQFFGSYQNLSGLISRADSTRSSVFIPAPSSSYEFHLPPIPVPPPAPGAQQDDDWAQYRQAILFQQKMEEKVQKCINSHFTEDIQQHELVCDNILSYLLDSLDQPSSFRPIPYLVSKPGVGKTTLVSEIIATANRVIAERRQKLADVEEKLSPESADNLKDFVLLEVVLPSVPNVSDLTGAVLPLVMDDPFENERNKDISDASLPPNANQLRVRAPGNENLPQRHSVTTWTWFTRTVDELARQGKQVVVFFDELSNISPEWEAVFLKMVEGKVGTWELPSSVLFLAAGNFAHQSAFGRKFKEPMQARLEFMRYSPHFGKWVNHMLSPDLPLNDYLARFAIVDFLCKNPQFFNPPDNDDRELSSLAPREWTLSANWIRRLSDFLGRNLNEDELTWYLAPRVSHQVADKVASHLTDNSANLFQKATDIWNAHMHSRQLISDSEVAETGCSSPVPDLTNFTRKLQSRYESDIHSLDELRKHSAELASRMSEIKNMLLKNNTAKSEEYSLMRNDIENHHYMTTAVKAYLLETPPPEGEFCDIIYLEGPPGYGKTSFARGIIKELNEFLGQEKFELIELNLASLTPSEVIGVPFPVIPDTDDGLLVDSQSGVRSPGNESLPRRHVVNTWTGFTRRLDQCLKEGKTPVVFIDEMSNISQQWEAILLKLSESKISSNWKINGPIRFIAAGNPPEDSRAGRHFKPAFNARLYRIPFRPSFIDCTRRLKDMSSDVFHEFAAQVVTDYLLLYPDQFVPPPGHLTAHNRLLCPRNWTLAASYYAMLLQSEAHRIGLPEKDLKNPDAIRGLAVNQMELKDWLSPVLPSDAVDGFAAFAALNSIVTGDEIILQGKSVPPNLTAEQIKIIIHSATASLSRNVVAAEKKADIMPANSGVRSYYYFPSGSNSNSIKEASRQIQQAQELDRELAQSVAKYATNFMNFIDTVSNSLNCRQQLDSLLMPNLPHFEPLVRSIHRLTTRVTSFDHALEKQLNPAFHRIIQLYAYMHNSIHGGTISVDFDQQSPSGVPPAPTTSPFLTTSSNPQRHRQLPGGGIS